jgi:predicted naringenin-chalcone synthase
MRFELRGIGTAQPEFSLTQDEALELHTTFCRIDDTRARTLRALYRRSGVKRRHSVLFENDGGPIEGRQALYRPAIDEDDRGPGTAERMALYETRAPELAKEAANRALEASGTSPDAITHLVTVSCTGFASPGVDAAIISGLGLPATTERTHVGFMGCHGALNGLRVAHSLVRTDAQAVPLLCAVELCSLHFAYGWDPDMMVANALFADGAAAVVGGEGETGGDEVWKVQATGSMLMPGSEDAMTWRIGDHGFRMTLSARVPGLIEANLRDWLTEWLGDQGLGLADIESWAVHPGGPRIVTSVQKSLGLSREQTAVSKQVLSDYGNMSSPTILFILDRLRKQGAPRPCVALAFGPGLVVEATLLT